MVALQCFSTSGIDPRRKLAYWNEHAGASFTPLVSDPVDIRAFHGSIVRTRIGELTLAEACSEAQTVHHSRTHVARTRGALFLLMLQLGGESRNRQDGREAFLKPGDFTLFDCTREYEIAFPSANRGLVLGIPEILLRRQIACPEALVAIPIRAGSGAAGLFSRLLRSFWVVCQQELNSDAAERVANAVLDLLGAAYAEVPRAQCERSTVAATQRIRITSYIETHLHDPQLTPTRVAQSCRITPRYLHHLFATGEETVGRYLLRRRLEGCARALVSSLQLGRTVAEIAFDHGFNSPTHFGRAFRARYGLTPRAYRDAHGLQAAAAPLAGPAILR